MGTFLNNHHGKKWMRFIHNIIYVMDEYHVLDEKIKVHVHELCASMNENLMMMDELHIFG